MIGSENSDFCAEKIEELDELIAEERAKDLLYQMSDESRSIINEIEKRKDLLYIDRQKEINSITHTEHHFLTDSIYAKR